MQRKILIADDDLFYRQLLSAVLEKNGYETVTAADAGEAEKMLVEGSVDLGILDYHLPPVTAVEVMSRVRKAGVNAPFIVITGDISGETERTAREKSPIFYFVKPIDMADIRDVVDNVFAKRTVL